MGGNLATAGMKEISLGTGLRAGKEAGADAGADAEAAMVAGAVAVREAGMVFWARAGREVKSPIIRKTAMILVKFMQGVYWTRGAE